VDELRDGPDEPDYEIVPNIAFRPPLAATPERFGSA
jgi:hypothetical protein